MLDLILGGLLVLAGPFVLLALLILLSSIKIVYEYEKGLKFKFGRFTGILEPGIRFVWPVINSWRRIDTRINTIDIMPQSMITKDNVPVSIDAVVYFRVEDPEKAVLNVEDYYYAISKYAQTSLRNVVGEVELDDLLSKREAIASELRKIVDVKTDEWGLKVTILELQDIKLPEDMKRIIARQAEAEREKRSVIIKAEGETIAADNLVKAATMLTSTPGALHLRTLTSLDDIASDQSNSVTFFVPVELGKTFTEDLGKPMPKRPRKFPLVKPKL
ncbi:slipin family protein [archaeon]|nr:slipin family protein [archaeon]